MYLGIQLHLRDCSVPLEMFLFKKCTCVNLIAQYAGVSLLTYYVISCNGILGYSYMYKDHTESQY